MDVLSAGVSDGAEDADGNGAVGPGETNPLNADSDGDDVSDGAEVAAGTDPLDPLDFPAVPSLGPWGLELLALLLAATPGAVRLGRPGRRAA